MLVRIQGGLLELLIWEFNVRKYQKSLVWPMLMQTFYFGE